MVSSESSFHQSYENQSDSGGGKVRLQENNCDDSESCGIDNDDTTNDRHGDNIGDTIDNDEGDRSRCHCKCLKEDHLNYLSKELRNSRSCSHNLHNSSNSSVDQAKPSKWHHQIASKMKNKFPLRILTMTFILILLLMALHLTPPKTQGKLSNTSDFNKLL